MFPQETTSMPLSQRMLAVNLFYCAPGKTDDLDTLVVNHDCKYLLDNIYSLS